MKNKEFYCNIKISIHKENYSLSKLKTCYEKRQQLREWMFWQVIFLEKRLYSAYIRNSELKNHTINKYMGKRFTYKLHQRRDINGKWAHRKILNVINLSVQFSCSVMSDSLWPHKLQHTRPPCPSPTPGVHSDSCPLSQWCHPAISSSVVPFSSFPQSLPASESLPMSQLFAWGGQSTGVSALASFLPKKSQGWSPSEWTDWISL